MAALPGNVLNPEEWTLLCGVSMAEIVLQKFSYVQQILKHMCFPGTAVSRGYALTPCLVLLKVEAG